MSAIPRPSPPASRDVGTAWLPRVTALPHPWSPGAVLQLRRAWPRSPGHVLLEYGSEEAPAGVVVGQWLADGRRLRRLAEAMAATAGSEAAALLPAAGVVLHGTGVDRRLVPLRRLLEDPAATLVVHRPERRAVVRIDACSPAARRWLKVVRPERVAALLARTAWLAPLGAAAPRLLDAQVGSGITAWADLPGVPLAELLGDAGVDQAMLRTGALLRRLHALPVPGGGATHDGAAEVQVLRQWTGHLRAFLPDVHVRVGALLGWCAELLEDPSGATPRRATVHRDLHDGQVLVAPSRVSLLDPDTVAAGEPELDLGNLLAHLRLAAAQGRCADPRADAAFSTALDAYGRDGFDRRRLRAYTAAALLRLVAVHAFRPATRASLPRLVEEAGRVLGREDALAHL